MSSLVTWIKGQLELGDGGFEHWQLIAGFKSKCSLNHVKSIFGDQGHWELTRSAAAESYVWKEETAVPGTRFELGAKPFNRSSSTDWQSVWDNAIADKFDDIDPSIRVGHYRTLVKIRQDHLEPRAMERIVSVFWGDSGTGKTRRAWEEAGLHAYPKGATTRFWDGYRNHEHVVLDEFRGDVALSLLLQWLDRYPLIVECKGSSVVANYSKIWITSNLHPRDWYPNADAEGLAGLLRRIGNLEHFDRGLLQ